MITNGMSTFLAQRAHDDDIKINRLIGEYSEILSEGDPPGYVPLVTDTKVSELTTDYNIYDISSMSNTDNVWTVLGFINDASPGTVYMGMCLAAGDTIVYRESFTAIEKKENYDIGFQVQITFGE